MRKSECPIRCCRLNRSPPFFKNKVAKLPRAKAQEIAESKMKDLNAGDIEAATRMIEGTARSMGIEIVD